MKQRLLHWFRVVCRGGLYALFGLLSAFILANSYEIAFSQSLPLVHAIRTISLDFIQPDITTTAHMDIQSNPAFEGNYGTPAQLKVSGSSVRVSITSPIRHGAQWLARASAAHAIIVSGAHDGDIGDMVLYMQAGKTTIPMNATVKAGANVTVDTRRDWRYLYRIDEVVNVSAGQRYVLPAGATASRLYIVVQADANTHMVIASTLLSVQNADQ